MKTFTWIEHEPQSGICECYKVQAFTLRDAVVKLQDFMQSRGRSLVFDDAGHAFCEKTHADFYRVRVWTQVD